MDILKEHFFIAPWSEGVLRVYVGLFICLATTSLIVLASIWLEDYTQKKCYGR